MPEGIQFEDDQDAKFLYSRIEKSRQAPKMVQWAVDKGWVKDGTTATYLLLVIVAAAIIIAVVYPMIFGNSSKTDDDPSIYDPNTYVQ